MKNLNSWKLNNTLLKSQRRNHRQMKEYIDLNENRGKNATFWDAAKAMFMGNL